MAVSEAASDEILIENCDNHVVVITLNRPERMNAISRDMLEELSKKMTEANKDPETRCIILTGRGRGFCAGLDLVDTAKGGIGSEASKGSNRPKQLFDLRDAPINVMWNIDTPIVCALNGAAAGYGMDLALLCDMRVAAE
ncbi:MAG: enoyl-CoA hydratase/isomerase family protein, partial [Pseudomonadota bacterium]|nr:enoyl-CoA hydratase/isomerase family protein [Pseudomonadota bacterium]